MSTRHPAPESTRFADVDSSQTEVLDPGRRTRDAARDGGLQEQAGPGPCKTSRAPAPRAGDDPQALARYIAHTYTSRGPEQAALGVVHRRYCELRGKLALANLKLVAHVAKRFRDRGIPYSDLIQEGFCGLLEAIDRFDLAHQTKLATYATWWIRQSMQRAVAAGAYPVRLTPRHLRQLAQDEERKEKHRVRHEFRIDRRQR